MEAQDAATAYFFKLWSWVETNVKTVVLGICVLAVAAILISYYFWKQNARETTAAEALTQLLITPPSSSSQLVDGYLKITTDYPGTAAAGRALALAAATSYASGDYAKAQAQFQKYLSAHPTGPLSATAALGLAASYDAQGQTNSAVSAYQRVIASYSDQNALSAARFALAGIDEQRGKFADAENLYRNVARNNPNSPLASEAGLHLMQLRSKSPATQTATNPTNSSASFNLTPNK